MDAYEKFDESLKKAAKAFKNIDKKEVITKNLNVRPFTSR